MTSLTSSAAWQQQEKRQMLENNVKDFATERLKT